MSKNKAWILMDRSGSMSSKWTESVGGVNSYVANLPKATEVQVDVFDASVPDWYLNVRNTTQANYEPLTEATATPRGMTALTDALGRLLTEVLASKAKKGVVLITTDGLENASREFKADQVRTLLKKVEAKGYEVIWMGADFAGVEDQAKGYGLAFDKTMDVSSKNRSFAYAGLGDMTTSYFSGASATINLDAKTKAAAVA